MLLTPVCVNGAQPEDTGEPTDEKFIVATILHNPPYVMEHPSAGIDLDMIRAIMAHAGVEVEFVHAPIARVEKLLEAGRAHAMTTFRSSEGLCENSEAFSYWHDGVVVSRGNARRIDSLDDLYGLKVGMFPGAERVLAGVLGSHIDQFGKSVTIFSASLVLRMLNYGRVDAYIGDYWSLDHAQQHDLEFKNEARLFDVAIQFEPTPRTLCIQSPTRLRQFNRGLEIARAEGELDSILARYRPAAVD